MKKIYFLFCVTTSKKQHNNQQQSRKVTLRIHPPSADYSAVCTRYVIKDIPLPKPLIRIQQRAEIEIIFLSCNHKIISRISESN